MFQRGLIPRAKETLVTLILLSGVVLGITFVLSAILDRDQGAITQLYSKYYIAKVFHYAWNIPVTSVAHPDPGSGMEKNPDQGRTSQIICPRA
jgi:hypothetical protein